jgi:hypothetical protein
MKRSGETRGAESLKALGYGIPNAMPEVINTDPDHTAYHWVRTHINGAEEDKQNFFRRALRGWVPVKVEDQPHLAQFKDSNGYISFSGCMLQKRDKAISQAEIELYEDQALGNYMGALEQFTSEDNSSRYVRKENETGKPKIVKGRLPGA